MLGHMTRGQMWTHTVVYNPALTHCWQLLLAQRWEAERRREDGACGDRLQADVSATLK